MPQASEIPSFNVKLNDQLTRLSQQLKQIGMRQAVFISGSPKWSWQQTNHFLVKPTNLTLICQKDSPLEVFSKSTLKRHTLQTCRPQKPNTLLGFESQHVILDCHTGFYPDAICAIAGTIEPGGFLFILCPPLPLWPHQEDDFAQQRTSIGVDGTPSSPNTIERFISTAKQYGAIFIEDRASQQDVINELRALCMSSTLPASSNDSKTNSTPWQPLWARSHEASTAISTATSTAISRSEPSNTNLNTETNTNTYTDINTSVKTGFNEILSSLSQEQQSALTAICSSLVTNKGPHKHFHIIQADRGRGKSHLLGLICKHMDTLNIDNGINPTLNYKVTAPNKACVQTIYKSHQPIKPNNSANPKPEIAFIAPENVLNQVNKQDILIVDEAASIPLPLLKAWAKHFQFIIFATTTHGYEGTGKGFQVRFMGFLKSLNTPITEHSLTQAIRYHEDDPLEALVFKTFCLDSEPRLSFNASSASAKEIEIKELTRQNLISTPELLSDVFALLVQAHYQTRPSDLRDILDAPGVRVFVLGTHINSQTQNKDAHAKPANKEAHEKNGFTPISVCLSFDEGNLGAQYTNLISDIYNGIRRPKGHLTPQVLALHMAHEEALTLKSARIVRIACNPIFQRQHYASQLLTKISNVLKNEGYDFISSSFADTSDVRSFWLNNQFHLIRTGNKLDQASGTRSALVIKGLSSTGINLQQDCQDFFNEQQKQRKSLADFSNSEKLLLERFKHKTGSYEAIKDILNRCQSWNAFNNTFNNKPNNTFKLDEPFPRKANQAFRNKVQQWLDTEAMIKQSNKQSL